MGWFSATLELMGNSVHLVLAQVRSASRSVKELDIHGNTLIKWIREYKVHNEVFPVCSHMQAYFEVNVKKY